MFCFHGKENYFQFAAQLFSFCVSLSLISTLCRATEMLQNFVQT